MVAALGWAGNLLIAATRNYVAAARTGTFYRRQMAAGHIHPIPGSGGGNLRQLALDAAGNLLVADTCDCNGPRPQP